MSSDLESSYECEHGEILGGPCEICCLKRELERSESRVAALEAVLRKFMPDIDAWDDHRARVAVLEATSLAELRAMVYRDRQKGQEPVIGDLILACFSCVWTQIVWTDGASSVRYWRPLPHFPVED